MGAEFSFCCVKSGRSLEYDRENRGTLQERKRLPMSSCVETAQFVERTACIACGSVQLSELSAGTYNDRPLHDFLEADPWGENPIGYLNGCRWSYVRCDDCEQAFHRFILAPEWNERRFSQWMTHESIAEFEGTYKTPDWLFRKGVENARHMLQMEYLTREIRGEKEPLRVLDFGCGYGDFLAMCEQFGFDAVGVDRSAARRDNGRSTRVFAELSDLDAAGFQAFHVITLFEVLEHLDDPRSLVELLAKYLVRGGLLILETPDCAGVKDIVTMDDYRKIHPLEHINGFTPVTMRRFAERLGFVAVQKPSAHVGIGPVRVAKTETKHVLHRIMGPGTQQYFRKK